MSLTPGHFFSSFNSDIRNKELWSGDLFCLKEQATSPETRDFGISNCVKAAKEVFSPEIIRDWDSLSSKSKTMMIQEYGNQVAKAFELKIYGGVFFEEMQSCILGYNNGDGSIYLNDNYIKDNRISPIELIDTITHELRHQYQYETIKGLHRVPEDVQKEWQTGHEEYTLGAPYVYDPWGYIYNPLEIDANYAGSTVIREINKDMINGNWA